MRIADLSLVALALLTACYDGASPEDEPSGGSSGTDTPAESTGPTPTTTTGPTTGSGPTTGDPGDTTADPETDGGSEESTGEPAADPAVHWVGRYDEADPTARRMGWSGAGLVVRFDGTGVTVNMDDAAQFFTVVVDGTVQDPLATAPGPQDYVLATGLPAGEHTVELYRRTEGSFGATVVHDVTIDGELLAPPPVTRRMEVIGDSITAGYGNLGTAPCGFSAQTEDHYLTYGAIAARTLGAEVQTVAWSGKGMVYNYGDDTYQPLPEVYDRILASDETPWDFTWQPDVVVINLGTNDFSTDNDPSQQLYTSTYVTFLEHLRAVYPSAFVLVVAPTLFGAEADMVAGYLTDVVAQRNAAGDPDVAFANINVDWIGSGCDGHPTVATHQGMAGRLVEELQDHVGW